MSSTPRKSSIRSTRTQRNGLPSSLRLLSHPARRTSNTHLSLVFAQGDSVQTGHVDTEARLTKQLDGDSSGKVMGLRSRRGSSATIRTTRTLSVSTPSVPEENEPGPSDYANQRVGSPEELPRGQGASLSPPEGVAAAEQGSVDARDTRERQRLNPKASTSWLRWNSPTPSFPKAGSRSGSMNKGKQKEVLGEDGLGIKDGDGQVMGSATGDSTNGPGVITDNGPSPPASLPKVVPPATDEPADSPVPLVAPPQLQRGWFGKSSTAAPDRKPSSKPPAVAAAPVPDPVPDPAPHALPKSADRTQATDTLAAPALSNGHANATNSEQVLTSESTAQETPNPTPIPPSGGWRGYLWGSQKPATAVAELDQAATPPATEAAEGQPEEQAQPVEPPNLDSSPVNDAIEPAQAPLRQGWGSYLYSYVATPRPPPLDSPAAEAVSIDPTAEQSPIPPPITPPALAIQAATPLPNTSATSDSTPLHSPSRKPSTSSQSGQSGWLNYLAFRASQKKIGNASTASIKSGKERRSMDLPEEVMDFSNDPDFPQPQPDKKEEKLERVVSKATSTSNLAVRNRRLSNNSTKSGHLTPATASPKAPGREKTAKTTSGSGLPPPPTPAPVQPSFVIPSFDTTFNRPPRSLPPAVEENKGITAATTGLAWRALGAVGSYYYGSQQEGGEARGMRYARRVGAELPRRLGAGTGKDHDGWKHVKRVAVVGVHGWFPAKMLNSVIGEPTGTSVKFANMMGAAVRKFFADKGVDDIRLTLMPLEGEGTIESRVDRLYKAYLSNPAWINDLRRADAVFFAAHSQGCIVTTHLISRMIAQGHIRTPLNKEAVDRCEWAFGPIGVIPDTTRRRGGMPSVAGADGGYQKVAMLAMCGVHLGPLYSISTSTVIQPYLQWFENAAARELFEFQDSTSAVSQAYQKAFDMVLENEVKVVLLASLNDQVVPIYGASFSTANHPLLLRALFVDGASYSAEDFMTNLLCFAFMLRNAGIDDQRLVEHLSEATAGSLTGVGHSAPYEDAGCYDLTVKYLFLSGPGKAAVPMSIEPFTARETRNDFELPWIMRALVDSPEVRDLFEAELKDLKEGVIAWKPATKALKEIKKRLEPMAGRQSKLRDLHHSPSSAAVSQLGTSPMGKGNLGLRRDW